MKVSVKWKVEIKLLEKTLFVLDFFGISFIQQLEKKKIIFFILFSIFVTILYFMGNSIRLYLYNTRPGIYW